jgi:epidermal growth factor receptor substrate 15
MLSFKEFCIAVYLMERHREHRPLPDTVTDAIWAEGTALPSTGQFAENPSAPAPQASAGIHPNFCYFLLLTFKEVTSQ